MSAVSSLCVHDLSSLSNEFELSFCSADFSVATGGGAFGAEIISAKLGLMKIFRYQGRGLCGGTRKIQHIRDNPGDDFVLLIPLDYSHRIAQFNNQCDLFPGDFSIISTIKPFESLCGKSPNYELYELALGIPATLLRSKIPEIDQHCGKKFDCKNGAGKVLVDLCLALLDQARYLSSMASERLGEVLLESLCLAITESDVMRRSRGMLCLSNQDQVKAKAIDYIITNLSNPDLDVAAVAEFCGVSLGYLHNIFLKESTTIGGLIRGLRLQQCRKDLRNPVLRKQSIIQIAMRWGYNNPASFTRAYRRLFDISPSEDRRKLASFAEDNNISSLESKPRKHAHH